MRGIHRAVRKHGVQEGSWFVVVSTPACTGHIKSTTVTGVEERFPLWLTSLTFTPMFFFHNEEAAIASFLCRSEVLYSRLMVNGLSAV